MSKHAVVLNVVKKVVKYARDINYPNSNILLCPDCHFYPNLPVTGTCGHTRCIQCIQANGRCFCGCSPPNPLCVNILVQHLVDQMLLKECNRQQELTSPSTSSGDPVQKLRNGKKKRRDPCLHACFTFSPRIFTNPQVQFSFAQYLLYGGQIRDAAAHFAHVATSDSPFAMKAVELLTQSIEKLPVMKPTKRRIVIRELYRGVRINRFSSWVLPEELECVVCYGLLNQPVTTLCGHTFCRDCILRTLEVNRHCPICRRSTDMLSIVLTTETYFVKNVLLAVTPQQCIEPLEPESKLIPIFKGTVAFPTVPCPILILGSSKCIVIRRILDSGIRKIGVISSSIDEDFPVCGTIVEVRDCIQLREGETILSTVGVSRFQVIKEYNEEDYQLARVVELLDVVSTSWDFYTATMDRLAMRITEKVMSWLSTLDAPLLADIENAFGPMPSCLAEQRWWADPNCPKWLWWIVAILPLRAPIQGGYRLTGVDLNSTSTADFTSMPALSKTGVKSGVDVEFKSTPARR